MHYIQSYILDKLVNTKNLRNRDMRPPKTESNLYQYHLKRLVDSGYVCREGEGYTLSTRGLAYADRHSSLLKKQRPQPKLITILALTNSEGAIVLIPRHKQPFIGTYNLPSGKIHQGESLYIAAERELKEKVGLTGVNLQLAGTVHLTIAQSEMFISEAYAFLMAAQVDDSVAVHNGVYDGELPEGALLMPGVDELLVQIKAKQTSHSEIRIEL